MKHEGNAIEISDASPAAHGVIFLSIATAAALLGGYVFHVVAARWLPAAEYGSFVVVLSIITWAENLQGAALSGPAKAVSEDHRRIYAALRLSVKWFLPSGVTAGILLLVAAPFIASGLGDRALTTLLVLAAVEIPLTAVLRLTARFSKAMRCYAVSSAVYSVYSLGRTVLGCSLIVLGLGAFGGIAGQVAATAVAAGLGVFLLLRAIRGLDKVEYPQMLTRSASWAGYSFVYAVAMSTLITMDMWCVKGLIPNAAQAGFYGAAFALARTPKFLIQPVTGAVFPRVSQALTQNRCDLAADVTKQSFRILFIVLVPLCVLVGESATEIINFLFSDRYSSAGSPLIILMAALSVYAFFQLLMSLTSAADRPGLRMAFSLVLVPIGLVLNFLLIPIHGIIGAAQATLITMSIGVLVTFRFVLRCTGAKIPGWTVFRCAISGMLVYGAASLWSAYDWMLIPKLAIMGMIYIAVLFIIGELGKKEIQSVAGAIPGQAGYYLSRLAERHLR